MRMRLMLNMTVTALSSHTQPNTEIFVDTEVTLSH